MTGPRKSPKKTAEIDLVAKYYGGGPRGPRLGKEAVPFPGEPPQVRLAGHIAEPIVEAEAAKTREQQ